MAILRFGSDPGSTWAGKSLAVTNPEQSLSGANNAFDQDSEVLKAQAERCRRLAAATYNREMAQSLGALAEQYERSAEELWKKARA